MITTNTDILTVIEKYNLQLAVTRKMSFFGMTCVAQGYTIHLRKQWGLSFEAVGVLAKGELIHSLTNDLTVMKATEKCFADLEKIHYLLDITPKRLDYFTHVVKNIKKIDHLERLRRITEFYPDYFGFLGIYNCFWRYLKLNTEPSIIPREMVERLGKRRNEVAEIYLDIEKILQETTTALGKGYLLFCTLDEMKDFLTKGSSKDKVMELCQRKKGVLHVYVEKENKEYISTLPEMIKEMEEQLFPQLDAIQEVKGETAYPGIIQGNVYNMMEDKPLPKNPILVTYMTTPQQTQLISQCKAVVTDEGSILCHAAVMAREMMIPTIIGTKIATKVFRTGDVVEVDAGKGIIKKIEKTKARLIQ